MCEMLDLHSINFHFISSKRNMELNEHSFPSITVISYVMLLTIVLVEVFRRFFTYTKFKTMLYQNRSVLQQIISLYLEKEFLPLLAVWTLIFNALLLAGIYIEVFQNLFLQVILKATVGAILISVCVAGLELCYGYHKAEVNACQADDKSIGSCWACGAYKAYFEVVLADIRERIIEFEIENKVQLFVKKLILVCPLSCDVRKTLTDKDENVQLFGQLRIIEHDQGANVNRKYKNPVYKVLGDETLFIAAECPNTLLTLWKIKDQIKYNENPFLWRYYRDCFLKNLKELLKDEPCILLIYDDLRTKQPLHKFLEYELIKIEKEHYI